MNSQEQSGRDQLLNLGLLHLTRLGEFPLHEPSPSAGALSAAMRGRGWFRLARAKSKPGEVEQPGVHGPNSRASMQVATLHEPKDASVDFERAREREAVKRRFTRVNADGGQRKILISGRSLSAEDPRGQRFLVPSICAN